jgi:hypothetical protein
MSLPDGISRREARRRLIAAVELLRLPLDGTNYYLHFLGLRLATVPVTDIFSPKTAVLPGCSEYHVIPLARLSFDGSVLGWIQRRITPSRTRVLPDNSTLSLYRNARILRTNKMAVAPITGVRL